jgi:hypothetical protein
MPFRPSYKICPGDRIEVEVVQPDGGRALVVGKLDAVPEAAGARRSPINRRRRRPRLPAVRQGWSSSSQ